jgi:hypothetical protein
VAGRVQWCQSAGDRMTAELATELANALRELVAREADRVFNLAPADSTPEQTAAPAPSGVQFPTLPLLPFVVRLTVGLGSGPVPLLRGPAAVGCEGRS